jgi:hypothetical protein
MSPFSGIVPCCCTHCEEAVASGQSSWAFRNESMMGVGDVRSSLRGWLRRVPGVVLSGVLTSALVAAVLVVQTPPARLSGGGVGTTGPRVGLVAATLPVPGTVQAWGNGYGGVLGSGTTSNAYTPVSVLTGSVWSVAGGLNG